MLTICSYCRAYIRGEDDGTGFSHGICLECKDYYKPQFMGLSVDKYLNRYPLPIVIVNPDGRILIANDHAKGMVNKDETNSWRRIHGMRFRPAP